ncbi:GmrSD restriction endonuclease domain-containing protein [Aureimonas leprariae]|nr:DUF262 domain-containing protein [Aureimonas leprariae]
MFDSTKIQLPKLLEQAERGKLQLPDFQRSYVWDEDAVISLIASVLRGFPVGALLTLETGGDINFKARPLEGIELKAETTPDNFLLDGQQRVTSLYKVLCSSTASLVKIAPNKVAGRYYYLDLSRISSENQNVEDWIVAVPENRIRTVNFGQNIDLDLSSAPQEYESHMFPLRLAFRPEKTKWLWAYRKHWEDREDVTDNVMNFELGALNVITSYEMPIIGLTKENSREAVCTVFEKVNVGGVKLDAFELLTAVFAGERAGFDLREDWSGSKASTGRKGRIEAGTKFDNVSGKIASTDFLQACTLLETREKRLASGGVPENQRPQVTCRREAMLSLPLAAYERHAPSIEHGFIETSKFLTSQGIVLARELPYPPQSVALACVFAILGNKLDNAERRKNLSHWYWTGVICEHYGSATETKIARDVPQLVAWLAEGDPLPSMLSMLAFNPERLHSLRTRRSAAYKGFHALLMAFGCQDFVTGKPFDTATIWQDAIDLHHVFPQSWCGKNGKPKDDFDCILNLTPLSANTNRYIARGDAPSVYLKRIEEQEKIGSETLDAILRTHMIEPSLLRSDDFEGFITDRKKKLSRLAADAMGSQVVISDYEEPGAMTVEETPDEKSAGTYFRLAAE